MNKTRNNAWHLRDVILLTLVAILTGVLYFGVVFLYNALSVALTPLGLAPFGNDLILGLWTLAAPLAACLLQKIGSATIGEILASAVEAIMGGQWGISTLISGFIQGIGSELGFTFTAYKRYDMVSLSLSALTTTIVTFTWDLFQQGYAAYHLWMIIALFFTRLLSIWLFGALLVHAVVKLLERSHMLRAE
ncbi:energy-coupling factor transporter substrate-binding protein [Ligilactobacillus salitolerans]|uniref:Energy-coupling factor transporter substrate-binding protein n=1 Tax=Ligilactobacillus salitolerans TaxID=1808352 RepID=A0A401IT47_9LACO|nr:ECF transporter S component [Ligilactobacillus salitolerans]GBG94694.1 energy-coupling factor transporter substrate-binding protein [Ligilactobacillus salitolerans]